MKSKKRGFTLPEVVVVLIIIALAFSISAALVPSKDKARDTARRLLCASGLRRIGAAMIMYADAYDNLIPAAGAMINGVYRRDNYPYVVYRGDKQWADTYNPATGRYAPLRLAYLFEAGFITEPNLFYCPANTSPSYKYQSYIDPPPWGTLPQNYNLTTGDKNQWVRIGYTYFPTDYTVKLKTDMGTGVKYREPNCSRFDRLDGTLPYATDLIWSRDSLSHKSGIRKAAGDKVTVLEPGINALFKDGHVVYCTDPKVFTDDLSTEAGVVWYMMDQPRNIHTDVTIYTIIKMIQP